MSLGSLFARLREIVFENLALKVLSFSFALALYSFIHGAQDAQRTFTVDVVAIPPPESAHRVLMTPLPPVRVTVAGSRTLLDELRAEDLGALQLDLRSGHVEHIDLDPVVVHVPPGAHAVQIDPPSVDLHWEDEITREIPIQASVTGQPAPGFVVAGAPTVEPATVKAKGPRSLVETIQRARADAFDVTGLSKDGAYERTLAIDRPPSRVTYDLQTATVRVEITRELLARRFVKVPVQVVGVARGAATPKEVDVEVKGPPEIVRTLRAEQVVPVVDLQSAGINTSSPGSTIRTVRVEIDHCTVEVVPHDVTVRWP